MELLIYYSAITLFTLYARYRNVLRGDFPSESEQTQKATAKKE